jgi:hypothetical protein
MYWKRSTGISLLLIASAFVSIAQKGPPIADVEPFRESFQSAGRNSLGSGPIYYTLVQMFQET